MISKIFRRITERLKPALSHFEGRDEVSHATPSGRDYLYSDEVDFVKSARQSLARDRVEGANLLLGLIALTLLSLTFWASQATVDEVTQGVGKVIPPSSVQTVQNLEGGIIAERLVEEGDHVKKGDILARIDDTMSNASYKEQLAQTEALRATLARLEAEAKGKNTIEFPEDLKKSRPDLIERETSLFEKRQRELDEQAKTLRTSLRLANDELKMTVPLVEKNIVSKVEQMRLEREVNEVEGKLSEIIGAFQSKSMEQYNEIKAEYESLEESLEGRQDRVNRTTIRSPVDGTVNKVHVKTLGGVLQPGERILDIVPDDDSLLVEAKVRPADIAFLRPGQPAVLKFTAYDFSIYGGLEGAVEHISADTIQDEIDKQHYYQIKVRNHVGELTDNDGRELPILTGMVVEVDILTGRRTVLQYLLKPLHRMRFNALRER